MSTVVGFDEACTARDALATELESCPWALGLRLGLDALGSYVVSVAVSDIGGDVCERVPEFVGAVPIEIDVVEPDMFAGALSDVSPLGVVYPPLGVSEALGIGPLDVAKKTYDASKRLAPVMPPFGPYNLGRQVSSDAAGLVRDTTTKAATSVSDVTDMVKVLAVTGTALVVSVLIYKLVKKPEPVIVT